jgi:hypothetical protein
MKEIVFVCGHSFSARNNNKFRCNCAEYQPIQQKSVDNVIKKDMVKEFDFRNIAA